MSKLSSKPPNTRVHGALFVISGTRGHKLVVSWPEKNLKSADDQVIGGFDAQFLADMLSPKAALCNQRFQLSIDELLFLGHPVLTNSITPLRAQSQSEIASMSMFHFVVVLDNDSDIAWVNQIYEQIVVRTVCAWRFEQLRCGYITREVELSLKATDISPGNSKGTFEPFQSSLVRDIRRIYESLVFSQPLNLAVNGWLPANLSFPYASKTLGSIKEALKPFQTLVFREDVAQILQHLPLDPSPLLVAFIQQMHPRKSFIDVQKELCCSLDQVLDMAAHLLFWRKARVIDVIATRNVYVVTRDANLRRADLFDEFQALFPGFILPKILADFSTAKMFGEHLPSGGSQSEKGALVKMLIWLLQHNYLTQLQTYLYPNINVVTSNPTEQLRFMAEDSQAASEDEKRRAKETWQQYIDAVVAGKPPQLVGLFKRISPYLDGKHSLNEIAWIEGIQWQDLTAVLSRFKAEIITCLRESPP